MKHKTAVIIVLAVAIGGMIFSGYLSYTNLWGNGCTNSLISCGGAKQVKIFGQPTCVYGFFMFTIEAIMAIFALIKTDRKPLLKWMFGLGIFGSLFAGGIAIYEVIALDAFTYGFPACIYGFVFYFLIFLFAMIGLRYKSEQSQSNQPPQPSQPIN
jgi:uncharacterized membrane protein